MKKVTAKNLMIGDWVKYRNEYWQVQRLDLKDFFGNNMVIELNGYPNPTISSATPIPITEEWLMLNGFEDSCTGMYERLFNGFKVKLALIGGTYSISISKDGLNRLIIHNQLYIHQLQQAYRLATGKELKIKF